MSNLYLDIETIPMVEPTKADLKAPASYKKPESIAKYIKDNKDALIASEVKKRSISMFDCRIVCVGFSFNDKSPVGVSGDEEALLKDFEKAILAHCKEEGGSPEGLTLIGFNIENFDAPVLYLKACKYGLKTLQSVFYFGRKNMVDVMVLGAYFQYKTYVSMDNLCKYFGIKGKAGVDGSKVFGMWKEGKIQEIVEYCCDDVDKTRKLEKLLMPY